MRKRLVILFVLFIILCLPATALAQTYSFSLDKEVVNAYWNSDGTLTLDYLFTFTNGQGASALDFVDVGVPNDSYTLDSVSADINGQPVSSIEASPYVKPGVAVGLGGNAIPAGGSGTLHVTINGISKVLRPDSNDKNFASADFIPTWFGSEYVHGTTDLTMIYHLPDGVKPDEPKWHASPSGFPSQPTTGLDDKGRVTYSWNNPSASGSTRYTFGASFPKQYIPAEAIQTPGIFELLGISQDTVITFSVCGCIGLFFIVIIVSSVYSSRKRKLQYMPPKVAIEGHGIKRGLTAVEAALLLEEPMDKIMTMILFAVIKKSAASVVTREPLKLEITKPAPEGLQPYEQQFLDAFALADNAARRKALQDMMVAMVKGVSEKMRGFSRRETVAYYKDIVQRAWGQVEGAQTPEVKSQQYSENLEWTMLDKDYEHRTDTVFRSGPVFVPMWWGNYDPGFGRSVASHPASTPTYTAGPSMPSLPGADFAASVTKGAQNFSSSVIGNVSDFTSKITNKTNPVPVATSSGHSYGGGGGCACACACAGCACACAGGGR